MPTGNISALQIDLRRQTVGVTRLTTAHAMFCCQPVAQTTGPRMVAKRPLIVLGLFVKITLTVWMQMTWRHVLLTSNLQASQLAQTFSVHSGKLHRILKFIF